MRTLLILLLACFTAHGQLSFTGTGSLIGNASLIAGIPCVNITFIDFEAGSDGVAASAGALLASTHGLSGVWTLANNSTWPFFDSLGQKALVKTICVLTNPANTTYTGAGSLGFRTDTLLSPTNAVFFQVANPIPASVSVGFFWKTDLPNNAVLTCDWSLLQGVGNTDFNNCELSGNGALRFLQETKQSSCGSQINITNNTWYWVTMSYGTGANMNISVYSTNADLIGTLGCHPALVPYTNFHLGLASGSGSGLTNNSHIYVDSIKFDYSGTFPLLP